MQPANVLALLALLLPLTSGLLLPLQTTSLSPLAKRSPPPSPDRSQAVDEGTQEQLPVEGHVGASSQQRKDPTGPSQEPKRSWYHPRVVRKLESGAQDKNDKEKWRNDHQAELCYRKAYTLFTEHKTIKESQPKSSTRVHFELTEKEGVELGYPGMQLYNALRSKYSDAVYNQTHPKRIKGQEKDGQSTKAAVAYSRSKLTDIVDNGREGTIFLMEDLKKIREHIVKERRELLAPLRRTQDRTRKEQAYTELYLLLTGARNKIMRDWMLDPYMRYMNDDKVPLPLLDHVIKEADAP
ncbi:hypothetical protein FA10DRAFT_297322 [Acaromyces ingoldii]|uniref:Uncharacterized protein n=1 Tax=Acaromyces ingoldii TaxID=215250 RepID=A0A316YFT1_9BASI|nr:hypothetical protein FA10DRAFT_297322 [Acaromyces ingoldii]PWN86963.1 hypothetical protein FA10DRAFT_297322 [Acaromyces ingoldii]